MFSGVLTAEGADDRRLLGGMMGAIAHALGRMERLGWGRPKTHATARSREGSGGNADVERRFDALAPLPGCGFPVVSLRSTTGYGLGIPPGCWRSGRICGHLRLRIEWIRVQRVLTAEDADDRRLCGGKMGAIANG